LAHPGGSALVIKCETLNSVSGPQGVAADLRYQPAVQPVNPGGKQGSRLRPWPRQQDGALFRLADVQGAGMESLKLGSVSDR
jgi:hypothetical protein